MVVSVVVDAPVVALLDALEAVRTVPAPAGQEAERVAALAHVSAQVRGVFLRELAAASPSAHGARNAADLLVQHAGVPAWQARRDAGLAARLGRVPGLADAVAGGGLELEAALVLVRAWDALPARLQDDALARALVALGQLVDLRDLRSKVDELLAALAPDVTDADLADAREAAALTLVDVGSTTRWEGQTDALTGELAREVLRAKAESLRGVDDPRTGPQLMMAALQALLDDAVGEGRAPGSPQLVVVTTVDDLARCADAQPDRVAPDDALVTLFGGTDVLPGGERPVPTRPSWGSHSRGGVPVGPRTLAALACRSVLSRLVLGPLGSPVDSSPTARQLSARERRALEHRAGYRCQRQGCGRPASTCVPHHVVPWALGGPSTQANTVLLCVSCHHLLHDRAAPLLLTTGRRIGPRGWLDTGPPDDPLLL